MEKIFWHSNIYHEGPSLNPIILYSLTYDRFWQFGSRTVVISTPGFFSVSDTEHRVYSFFLYFIFAYLSVRSFGL